MAEEIDRARTEALALQLGRALSAWHEAQTAPPSRENVFITLNAFAFLLVPILAGTGFDPTALNFFRRALVENMILFASRERVNCEIPEWLAGALDDGGDEAAHAGEGG